jgi:hypothetical protein
MSLTDVEDRLSRSLAAQADALVAPAGPDARRAVARRAVSLRRRRRAVRAVAGMTALVVAVAAAAGGLAWSRGDDPRPVLTGPDVTASWHLAPPPADLPAFTVEDLAPTQGEMSWFDDSPDAPPREPADPVTGDPLGLRPSIQAFRPPRDYAGPSVHVTYGPTIAPAEGAAVTLTRGADGRLDTSRPEAPRLSWRPDGGSDVASAQAWGVSSEDLVAFVDGLVLRPDGTGFDATELPAAVVEDPVDPPADPSQLWSTYRVLDLVDEDGEDVPGPVQITVMRSDEADFELTLSNRMAAAASVEQTTVLGRPAVLVRYRDESRWSLQWRHDTADRVEVVVVARDRAAVDHVLASLREIDQAAWDELIDQAGDRPEDPTTNSTPMTLAD